MQCTYSAGLGRSMDFVLTSDLDWASEFCVRDFLSITKCFSIKPTLFVTHQSKTVDAASRNGLVDLGIHPNFLSDSDHGGDVSSVLNYVSHIVPGAIAVRCHRYIDSPEIAAELPKYSVKIDSNQCCHLARGLSCKILPNGLLRLPVFFEDDVHWSAGCEWNFESYAKDFFSSGLKILNFHPFFVTLNIPDADFYLRHKWRIRTLTRDQAKRLRYTGAGTRTFLLDAIKAIISRGYHFIPLPDLAARLTCLGAVQSAAQQTRHVSSARQ
jgi:hypothetical protein